MICKELLTQEKSSVAKGFSSATGSLVAGDGGPFKDNGIFKCCGWIFFLYLCTASTASNTSRLYDHRTYFSLRVLVLQ